ncbi:MAG: DUF4178 domain-containing protein [Marinifilaceae bacterium]|jgi:hypothetical protein
MGLFDFFKKKDVAEYDVTNMKLTDLNEGFVFEYDLNTWTVEKTFEYDWGENFFTREHKINNGKDTFYLSVCEDDELEISLSKKIRMSSFEEDIPSYIKLNEEPPSRISLNGETYMMDSGSAGFIRDIDSEDWEELMSWDYYNSKENKVLCIEQYDESEFEASCGIVLEEYEISNILPA